METIAESGGVIPHHHHPIAGSNYFPQKDAFSSYFFPSSANPQSMYHGYGQGDADVRSMIYAQRKGHERRGEGEERGGGMPPVPPGNADSRYYLPSSQSSQLQQHPMTPYHHQQSPHRNMGQFLSPQRIDDDKANVSKISDGIVDSPSPEKRSGKDMSKNSHSFENNAAMTSPYYYNNKQGRQPGFLNDARHPSYDSSGYTDMRDSVKDVYDSFGNDRNKEDGGKVEAVPVAYDENEIRSQIPNNQHYREKLERSTSQDAVAARNMMNCREYIYEGDHRPRAITMNSMYSRREGPPVQNGPYGNKNHELFNKMRDHFNQSGMNNPYYYRDKEKEGMPPMSPSSYISKHQRRLSGGESRTPSRQDLMNRLMMVPQEKFHQPELRPPFLPMNQSLPPQQHPSLPPHDQDQQSPVQGQLGPNTTSPRKSLESSDERHSPRKTPTGSEAMSRTHSPYGPSNRKSPAVNPEDAQPASDSSSSNQWISSNISPKYSDKKALPGEETAKSKFQENAGQDSIKASSTPKEDSSDNMQIYSCNDGGSEPNTQSKRGSSSSLSPKADSPSVTPSRKLSSDTPSPPDALPRELVPKKELLSDDGEDDSYHSSGNYPPMTPPSPNSSSGMSYPSFQQPFFPSPERFPSHIPHPHSFGPRGLQDGGPGMPSAFPFNKEMPGRFPMPGLGRDMALGGPGGPFMGQMPLNVGLDKDVYFCHLCSYSGKSKEDFDNHMSIHFEYNCPHCDYTSRTEGRLKRHIKDFHTDENGRRSMPGRPKVFKCKQCSFSATEKDKFWEHARSHIKEDKLLQCPKCPFVTEYKHHLEYHLRNHFGSKPFKCNKCNYSCVNKSMLNSHMKSHTNVYQYRCSDCTYATKYCHSLKLHLRKYNHKPATVLNQDGSLPQGMDVDSSGLAVSTKRGPPRGPRGPRKDKNDPYFNQMFGMPPLPMGMPPGMNPMLKGMMPFWPVMPPSGLPTHPGMMPGLPSMPQHMGIRGGGGNMDIRDRQALERNDSEMNGIMSGEDSPMKEDEEAMYLPCRLCDFVGEGTEALCLHLLKVHKDETGEMANIYGISESTLAESMERAKKAKIDRAGQLMDRRMSDISGESENDLSNFRRRNTIAGLLSRDNPDFPRGNPEKPYWSSPFAQGEKTSVDGRIQDLCYVDEGNDDVETENESGSGMDILQQMTLKFGGALPAQRNGTSETELNKNVDEKREDRNDDKPDGQKKPLGHKESPLDLTKPKSVSPPMFSNPSSPRRMDEFNSEEDEIRPLWMDSGRGSELDKVTENLARKRQISEMEDNFSGNNAVPEASSIVPRKRSRKGKAYKLETLCMKLQERRSNSPNDTDEADSDCEFSVEKFQPLQVKSDDAVEKEKGDDDNTDEKIDKNDEEDVKDKEESEINDVKSDETSTDTENVDMEMKDNVKIEELEMKTKEEEEDGEVKDKEADESLRVKDEGSDAKENDEDIPSNEEIKKECADTNEFDDSFEKLQETLNNMNADDVKEKPCEVGTMNEEKPVVEVNNRFEESEKVDMSDPMIFTLDDDDEDDDDDDAKTEILGEDSNSRDVFDLSDKENSGDEFSLGPTSEKPSEEVEIKEKVDMINTVLENRKKPLPPAVRRGTELAWKLLNDPINPVTSIPIPAVSPPLSEWKSPPCSSPMASTSGICTSSLANNLASSPMKNGIRMGLPFNQGLPPPPMKQHLPIPLPPTPMAFIPPTNRIMPEHMMHHPPPMPMPVTKPVPKDMYECTYCDLSFRDCVMYTVHMGYHSNRNPFKCNSCGIICRDKVEFFLHIARSPHS